MKSKYYKMFLLYFLFTVLLSLNCTVLASTLVSGNIKENLEDNVASIPVEGIRVTLKEKNTGRIYSTVSDQYGEYRFQNIITGTYDLEFKYGDITVLQETENENLTAQDILKYNGQDYIASNMNGVSVELAEQVIPQIGNTAAQVFFVLDNSGSMIAPADGSTINPINLRRWLTGDATDYTTRLDIVKAASKNLVEEIFEKDENIYMGLIKFNSTPTMLSHVCRDTESLQNHIDDLVPEGGTEVSVALELARTSFVQNEGAKIVIFLSDGNPNDDDNDVKEEIKKLRADGIELFALIVKDEVNEGKINNIFREGPNGTTKLVLKKTGDELVECIVDFIPTWIKNTVDEIRTQQEQTITLPTIENSPEHGIEDTDRRNKVDKYFSYTFRYNDRSSLNDTSGKTYLFKCLDRTNDLSQNELNYFSNHTYMTVTYHNIVVNENTKLTKLNLKLKRRDPFLIDISVKAVALKITLSDRTELYREINSNDDFHIFYTPLDEDLAHGSLVEIEYEVTINNNSKSAVCTHLELLSYLPTDLTLANNQKLITNSRRTNSKNGWYLINRNDLDELYEKGFISEGLHNDSDLMSRKVAKISLDYSKGFFINPQTNYKTNFVASICLSDANQMTFDTIDYVEVLGYENNKYRRMESVEDVVSINAATGDASSSEAISSIYPGDGKRDDVDFAEDTNKELIVPPTGTKNICESIFYKIINFALSLI